MMASAAVGDVGPVVELAASITEDVAVIGGQWVALHHPWLFLGLLLVVILLMI